MDFVRLAMREARRNATRTLVAVLAVALAAAAPIVARVIPEGYPTGFHLEERQFIGGDLVIWRAVTPVNLREDTKLSWRPWGGDDWQSHALYFLPALSEGYLAEVDGPAWGPLDLTPDVLLRVDGILEASPYLSTPCVINTLSGPVEAVLRGRNPDETGSPLSMEGLIKSGRHLRVADSGTYAALMPLDGVLPRGSFSLGTETLISVGGTTWPILPVGTYDVLVGEAVDYNAQPDPSGRYPVMFLHWKRPEIFVTEETFRAMAGDDTPVYQYSARVEKVSELESTVAAVRDSLGPQYAVYSVPELARLKSSAIATPVIEPDLSPVLYGLSFGLSGVIVTGSVYILLSQQRRKIGLLRVVGATRTDIVVYVLTLTVYITLIGDAAGFAAGKLLSLLGLISSDMTLSEWLRLSALDLFAVTGSSLSVTVLLGVAVGSWASRIPCAEVLRRE